MFQRKRSGAIVCPACGRLVDVRARSCPSCSTWRPGVWGFGPLLATVRKAPFHLILVGAFFVMYAASLLIDRPQDARDVDFWNLISPTGPALYKLGATGMLPVGIMGRWETLVTAAFLHANLLHLIFNCSALWQLGPDMQDMFGGARSFAIFILAGILGNLASYLMSEGMILIGSSGGGYGMLGAFVWWGYHRGGMVGRQVLRFGIVWGGIGFALSLAIPFLALWAHAGGFVGGFLCGALFGYEETRRSGPWLGLLAIVLALGVIAAFAVHLVAVL